MMKDTGGQLTWALVVYLIQIPILVAYELGVIPIHPITIILPLVGFLNGRVDRRGTEGLGLKRVRQPGRSSLLIAVFAALGLGGQLAAVWLEGLPLRTPTLTMTTMGSLARDLAVDVLIIALWEEVVSRGYIQTRLQEVWGFRGVLVTTLLFASLHVPTALHHYGLTAVAMSRLVQVLLVGFMLGYLYWWTRSVYVTIALHGLRNFLTLSLMMHLTGVSATVVQTSQMGCQLMWALMEAGLMISACSGLFGSSPATATRRDRRPSLKS